ncbi:MAG: putative bifunctional diguanylate cyclase/phosphodiesterase [Parashewanella sp.]
MIGADIAVIFLVLLLSILAILLLNIKIEKKQDNDFIQRLTKKITAQMRQRTALSLSYVPAKYSELSLSLTKLLNQLPPPIEIDKLTGLLNRLGLKQRLSTLMPVKSGYFILLDVHHFRYVNDVFGFSLGDLLLLQLSQRLQNLSIKPKLLARMNGAEFFLYFDGQIQAEDLCDLRHELQKTYRVKGTALNLRFKVGVLDVRQFHSDVSLMLKRVDLALQNSALKTDMVSYYQAGDDIIHQRELDIVAAIPKAIKLDEPHIVYQPKQCLEAGGFSQLEALIRWQHSRLGELSPSEFIPLAERAGVISMLSSWMINKVMQQQADWRSHGYYTQTAINLSGMDLSRDSLVDDIKAGLLHYQIPASCLSIELTESRLIEDQAKAIDTMTQLRELGVAIAIDDFGTGHSSLSYLKHLPIDEIKIDRSFLENVYSEQASLLILETSISLPKKLGLFVTVEGVESEDIAQLLMQMGADKIQGHYFCEPLLPAELELRWNELSNHKIKVSAKGEALVH